VSHPDWDFSVYYRIRWYNVLRPPPLHVSHRDDRGPINLAGTGPPSTLRRLCCKAIEFGEIKQSVIYYVVQGHSRSPISVPMEKPYATSCV